MIKNTTHHRAVLYLCAVISSRTFYLRSGSHLGVMGDNDNKVLLMSNLLRNFVLVDVITEKTTPPPPSFRLWRSIKCFLFSLSVRLSAKWPRGRYLSSRYRSLLSGQNLENSIFIVGLITTCASPKADNRYHGVLITENMRIAPVSRDVFT